MSSPALDLEGRWMRLVMLLDILAHRMNRMEISLGRRSVHVIAAQRRMESRDASRTPEFVLSKKVNPGTRNPTAKQISRAARWNRPVLASAPRPIWGTRVPTARSKPRPARVVPRIMPRPRRAPAPYRELPGGTAPAAKSLLPHCTAPPILRPARRRITHPALRRTHAPYRLPSRPHLNACAPALHPVSRATWLENQNESLTPNGFWGKSVELVWLKLIGHSFFRTLHGKEHAAIPRSTQSCLSTVG